jgi:peptidoglycan DL-endopeptidase CwlO
VRTARGVAVLAATAAALAIILPSGTSGAQTVQPRPSLSSLVAEANKLSNQIDSLGQQFDGLRIQLAHARAEAKVAELAAKRDTAALAESQQAVAQLAEQGYMNAGLDPTLQLLTSGDPAEFLNQASAIQELDTQAGERFSILRTAQLSTQRARETALQQIAGVNALEKEMNAKARAIQAKLDVINSAAMRQAMNIFDQTGQYPAITLPLANTVGAVALRYALTRRGDPYVWGAAGPNAFDCSGLVVWAFAQEGIALPHYTGSLWDSGMHVSRSDLEPGDLVFFFQDISHVGMYIGNGLMVDAPTQGQDVQVQAIDWSIYVGAVRIA